MNFLEVLFKKKERKETRFSAIFPDAMLYDEYVMSIPEMVVVFVIGFAIGVAVGYVFYGLWFVSVLMGLVVGIVLIPVRIQQCIDKQIDTLKLQFRALLESVSTSLGAGRNVVDSFSIALSDMREQYSADAYIVKEVAFIVSGLHNNINIEELLFDLADRSGITDIQTFADVFDTSYRQGGNIKDVIASTYKIINDKMAIEMEIKTMVASSESELNIMCVMPVIFVFILNTMGSNITGQGTPTGYIATTVALVIFVAAYFVGKKIMAIKM